MLVNAKNSQNFKGSKSGNVNVDINYSDQAASRISSSIYQKYRRNHMQMGKTKDLSLKLTARLLSSRGTGARNGNLMTGGYNTASNERS